MQTQERISRLLTKGEIIIAVFLKGLLSNCLPNMYFFFSNNSGWLPVFVRIIFIQWLSVHCECLTLTVKYTTPQDSGNTKEKAMEKMPHPEDVEEWWNGMSSGYGIGFKLINSYYLGKNVQNWALLLSILQISYIHLSGNTVVYIGLLQRQNIKVHIFYIIYVIIDNYLSSL